MKEFEFREFVKKGLIDAVGHRPDYWVRLTASEYRKLDILEESDLAEIDAIIKAQYPEQEDTVEG